jgi:hypothetical protein
MRLSDRIINAALPTPYLHLAGYMERYWIVPYLDRGSAGLDTDGTGPLPWRHRPFSRALQHLDVAVRVHHILRSDDDRAFHDHPWPYVTIVLRGGYVEVTPLYDDSGIYVGDRRVWRGPGSVLWRPARSLHRLEVESGQTAWTLFITGPKCQTWGFVDPARGKVPYRDWL